jgi:hypothetical protein
VRKHPHRALTLLARTRREGFSVYRRNPMRTEAESRGCSCCPVCRGRLDRLERWFFRGMIAVAAAFAALAAIQAAKLLGG